MANSSFHQEPYDAGTLTKLKIFELYVQEWIPVFTSQPEPRFSEVHIFDLFSGPGTDSVGTLGSPLRTIAQLRDYATQDLAGWSKVKFGVHFSDSDGRKTDVLREKITHADWLIPGISPSVKQLKFSEALELHRPILENPKAAKLLILDQFGVDAVTEEIFQKLMKFPVTDFIFFLSSSTLHRFRDHSAIKIKIDRPEDSYDVHRAAFNHFKKIAGEHGFLGRFSIRKRSNIYGLIFGSKHPLGVHKFLSVAWSNDQIAGEANFDIDRENVKVDEMLLPLDEFRPKKIQEFEQDLEAVIRTGAMLSEADLIRFAIESGMTSKHCGPVLTKLKNDAVIECDFRSPDIRLFSRPRPIKIL